MEYKTRQRLSDQELKWYYQGKMLNDADELGVYDEYLEWIRRSRNLNDLQSLSDFFDSAINHVSEQPHNEARRVFTKDHMKQRLSTKEARKSTLSDELQGRWFDRRRSVTN